MDETAGLTKKGTSSATPKKGKGDRHTLTILRKGDAECTEIQWRTFDEGTLPITFFRGNALFQPHEGVF